MQSELASDNRFLIIDNYPFGRDTLRRNLLHMGARQVDTAVNANTAISMCQDVTYDMVLSDYDLGEGKNGQQLLEELRTRKLLKNGSAFIILTAETTREVVLNTLEFQPDDYLAKPYIQKILIQRVKRMLLYKYQLRDVFSAIDSGNVSHAIGVCETHLKTCDGFRSRCLRLLASLYFSGGQFDEAQKIYDDELIDADSDWARMGLANLCLKLDRHEEAEALYLRLIEINYMYVEAYEHLSIIYQEQQEFKKAEDIIRRAVNVSPLSLRKQHLYAQLCEMNNHFDVAADVWKSIVKISKKSKNDSADNHLNLSRCLTDLCDYNSCYDEKSVVNEIFNNLDLLRRHYHVYGDKELQTLLIEARAQFGIGEQSKGQECVKEADLLYKENPESYSAKTQLEFAKSLVVSGDSNRAQQVLSKLVANNHSANIVLTADKILDEPVSKDGKKQIIRLNRKGIGYFKKKQYKQSVQAFRKAQICFPRNVELNLNLIQALVKTINVTENNKDKEQWLSEATSCLSMIESISAQHKKYNNYRRLREEVNNLQGDAAA